MSNNARRFKKEKQEEKVDRGNRQIRDKFLEERKIPQLQAKNENQRQALQMLPYKQMMVLSGASGVGKTEIACWFAAKEWREGRVENIILTRPNKSMDGDNAAIPGSDFAKCLPYTMAMLMKFKKYLGTNVLKNNLRQDMGDALFNDVSGIQVFSMEKLNGLSFDSKTIIIADELQSATVGQVKSLVTRLEQGARIFALGDPLQSAIGENNGLNFLLDVVENNPHDQIGVVKFNAHDCCREGISAHFTKIFEGQGNWSKNA